MAESLVVVLFLAGAAALVVLIVMVSRHVSAKRRTALEAVALQSGWSFAADRVRPEELGAAAFPLFRHGRSQRAYNVMRGSDGPTHVAVFDYRYTVGTGKHQRTISQTVVHVRSPRLSLPAFVLAPENILHKVGGLFGYRDIDFDSSPDFSKKYLLRGGSGEERIRDTFTPSVRAYFEQRPPVSVEGEGDQMVVYRRRLQKPEDVRTFVEDALAIVRQIQS